MGGIASSPRARIWLLAAILLPLVAGWLAGIAAERRALAGLAAATTIDARLRAALLDSEVARFRLLPLAFADDRDVVAAVAGSPAGRAALDRKLETLAAATGGSTIYVLAPGGRAIAASNWRAPESFVGQDYAFRRYYREATRTGAASQFALGTISHLPGLFLSRRTPGGGVIVVKLDFDRIERQWRQGAGDTYVTDRAGVVLVTSNPAWRFATTRPLPPAAARRFRDEMQSGAGSLAPLPALPRDRLRVETATGVEGWRLAMIVPVRPATLSIVRSIQAATALAVLALIGVGWMLRERARRGTERETAAAARTIELEAAVTAATADLRHEMGERATIEARADSLREGLRQANRLATLGQVTASVAHETAQPVAAIRTYAANGERLLDRGDTAQVRANLQTIGRLADRIGVVTDELRGFARKGSGAIAPVPLADPLEGALLILKQRLATIALSVPPVPPGLCVRADRVRLEQVFVILLQNAAEALEGRPDPAIRLTMDLRADTIGLVLADNGPGIATDIADRLFTPFVTSRAKGLGLGLVIAQDIMADLGGSLCLLPAETGARFGLALMRA